MSTYVVYHSSTSAEASTWHARSASLARLEPPRHAQRVGGRNTGHRPRMPPLDQQPGRAALKRLKTYCK